MQYIILDFNFDNLVLINKTLNLDLNIIQIHDLFNKINLNSLSYLDEGFDKIVFKFNDIIIKYCSFETIIKDFSKIIYIPNNYYDIILDTGVLFSNEKKFKYKDKEFNSIIIQKKAIVQNDKNLYDKKDVCYKNWDHAIEQKYSSMFLNTLQYLKTTNKLTLHSKQAGFVKDQPILFDW